MERWMLLQRFRNPKMRAWKLRVSNVKDNSKDNYENILFEFSGSVYDSSLGDPSSESSYNSDVFSQFRIEEFNESRNNLKSSNKVTRVNIAMNHIGRTGNFLKGDVDWTLKRKWNRIDEDEIRFIHRRRILKPIANEVEPFGRVGNELTIDEGFNLGFRLDEDEDSSRASTLDHDPGSSIGMDVGYANVDDEADEEVDHAYGSSNGLNEGY
ncbi:hypothetical protein LIER_37228 [Lithospermum erythrorhizon]|uniref:Uncharacterized protein n=1 Tax=Lithospermum erythrorhizon TaxID=34254 RepID=A0AAV3PIK5_LITER